MGHRDIDILAGHESTPHPIEVTTKSRWPRRVEHDLHYMLASSEDKSARRNGGKRIIGSGIWDGNPRCHAHPVYSNVIRGARLSIRHSHNESIGSPGSDSDRVLVIVAGSNAADF